MTDNGPRVQVAVRIRPVLKTGGSALQQQERFSLECASKLDDFSLRLQEQKLEDACRNSTFTFDFVFDQESTQHEVYEDAVVDLIDAALLGSNATILAYGQTGSGKTHTVLGEVKDNPLEQELLTANTGLFMRSLRDLLEYKQNREKKCHVVIGLSCIEIYNESVRDLISSTPMEPIKVVMDDDGVYMPNLAQEEVVSLRSVYQIFKMANARRQTRATEANEGSSRSHCLFVIDILQQEKAEGVSPPSLEIVNVIPQKDDLAKRRTTGSRPNSGAHGKDDKEGFQGTVIRRPGEPPIYVSKVVFADLAGSEKLKHSQAEGAGRKEAVNINSSLTALGNVVHALFEGSKHVPYRDSKLTRILRPAFNHAAARVLLLAALSPTQLTYDESVSTCHFANKVKAMKVVTQTTADTHNLLFEYLETLKMTESLTADLRIANAMHNWRATIRRSRPDLLRQPWQLYTSPAANATKHTLRVAALKDAGLVEMCERDNIAVQRFVQERNATEARELEMIQSKTRDALVEDHRVAVHNLQTEVEELEGDNAALRNESARAVEYIESQCQAEERELSDLVAEIDALVLSKERTAPMFSQLNAESQKLVVELTKRKDVPAGGSAPLAQHLLDQATTPALQEDEAYANLTAYHLSAQRFCKALIAMRSKQCMLQMYRRYTGELCAVALENAMKLMDVLPGGKESRSNNNSNTNTSTNGGGVPQQPIPLRRSSNVGQ
eukprot:PhM_4_TR10372/c0_g1_i1/m.83957